MINKKNMIALTLCGLMMASGSALAGLPSGDSDNNINTNPENDAGTQGTGGVVHFTGKITDASCNITTDSAGQTVELGTWAASYFATQKRPRARLSRFQLKVARIPLKPLPCCLMVTKMRMIIPCWV